MSATLLAVIILTFLKPVNAENNATACPRGCDCVGDLTTPGSQLTIDCTNGLPNIDEEQLTQQLNSLLSTNHFTERLTSLTIRNTPLTRVPASTCKLVNLSALHLGGKRISKLPDNCFPKLTKLVSLSMQWNSIAGLFDGLQNLLNSDLSHNHISFIGLRVFSNTSDLTSLRSPVLDYNKLTSLEPWWYYRCIHGRKTSPVTINLKENLISNFTNELQFKFRFGMKKSCGNVDLSWNRMSHIMDLYEGWNIVPGSSAWYGLRNIQGARAFMKITMGGTYYQCDCMDYPIYKLASVFTKARLLSGVACTRDKFISLVRLRMYASSIPLSQFTCQLSGRCPSKCQCVYRPYNVTLYIYCSATNLSSLPLDLTPLPKKCKCKLDFSNNKLLRRLERRPYFVNASILDVSNCALTEVLKDVSRCSLVNFQRNIIQSFPGETTTVNISATLLIGGNPWRCSCDNSWMIGWLQSLSHEISVVSVVFILLIARILVYKLRVRFFKRLKFDPFDRDECIGEDMDNDVFLCCSSQDEDPHGRHILEQMESNGYRVYYHERDFLPGQLILDNVAQGIERSKRTLCLISDNFLKR